jgi:protocatechuate 3,4-dioxygenase, beta subunit
MEEPAPVSDTKPQAQPAVVAYGRPEAGTHPPLLYPEYASTVLRAPKEPLVWLAHTLTEVTGPVLGDRRPGEFDHDLTRQHDGEPLGERIIVHGRVIEEDGRPVPDTLVEIWQCNAAGRYHHPGDQHDAPLDPNFYGGGRSRADAEGNYRFVTVKPGAYPWKNHHNAWRPAHIHFSLFGPAFATRLITQMYFPQDPLLAYDPIYNSVPAGARERLQAAFDMDNTRPEWALAYKFDIVLRGRNATPMEH